MTLTVDVLCIVFYVKMFIQLDFNLMIMMNRGESHNSKLTDMFRLVECVK